MWLIEKIWERVETNNSVEEQRFPSNENSNLKEKLIRLPSNVLTPEMVPDFFIPPTLYSVTSLKGWKNPQTPRQRSFSWEKTVPDDAKATLSNTESVCKKDLIKDLVRMTNSNVIQIESAENVSTKANTETVEAYNDHSCLSMFSLREMPSYYGVLQLQESAHTRRKESLFHMDVVNAMQVSQDILNKSCTNSTCWHSLQTSLTSPPEMNNTSKIPKREGLATCGSLSSTESSPLSSPLLLRTLSGFPLFKFFSQNSSSSEVSRSESKQSLRTKYSSTDEWSSGGSSPCSSVKSFISCPNLLPLVASPFDYLQCQERLQREHVVKLDKRGIIRLSAEYSSDRACLRVRVIATEELYEKSFKAKNVNCNVIMYLVPGKVQRQQSSIIKNSKNPIFNEDFFFDGILQRDLMMLSLKIKVINKGTNMTFDTLLGAKSLPLSDLTPF